MPTIDEQIKERQKARAREIDSLATVKARLMSLEEIRKFKLEEEKTKKALQKVDTEAANNLLIGAGKTIGVEALLGAGIAGGYGIKKLWDKNLLAAVAKAVAASKAAANSVPMLAPILSGIVGAADNRPLREKFKTASDRDKLKMAQAASPEQFDEMLGGGRYHKQGGKMNYFKEGGRFIPKAKFGRKSVYDGLNLLTDNGTSGGSSATATPGNDASWYRMFQDGSGLFDNEGLWLLNPSKLDSSKEIKDLNWKLKGQGFGGWNRSQRRALRYYNQAEAILRNGNSSDKDRAKAYQTYDKYASIVESMLNGLKLTKYDVNGNAVKEGSANFKDALDTKVTPEEALAIQLQKALAAWDLYKTDNPYTVSSDFNTGLKEINNVDTLQEYLWKNRGDWSTSLGTKGNIFGVKNFNNENNYKDGYYGDDTDKAVLAYAKSLTNPAERNAFINKVKELNTNNNMKFYDNLTDFNAGLVPADSLANDSKESKDTWWKEYTKGGIPSFTEADVTNYRNLQASLKKLQETQLSLQNIFNGVKFKNGGNLNNKNMNKYQQGGAAPQEDMQAQVAQLVQAAMAGDEKATLTINKIMEAAKAGDQLAMLIALIIQLVAQLMQGQQAPAAKYGAKLGYIHKLASGCPEGTEAKYFKKGGHICRACVEKAKKAKCGTKALEGAELEKCGGKAKKKYFGGNVTSNKCGGKAVKNQDPAGPIKKLGGKKLTGYMADNKTMTNGEKLLKWNREHPYEDRSELTRAQLATLDSLATAARKDGTYPGLKKNINKKKCGGEVKSEKCGGKTKKAACGTKAQVDKCGGKAKKHENGGVLEALKALFAKRG